jgi:spore germination protein YaaH
MADRLGAAMRRVTAWVGATAVMVAALVMVSASGQAEAATARKVSAWLPYWDTRGYQTFLDNADLYADLSPFWYELSAGGVITPYPGAENATIVTGAKAKGVAVIPTISNNFDPVRVRTMLSAATNRAAHVTALTNLVVNKGYDGIDVDYESLYAGDRSLYSTFVSELAAALHARGKKLTVAVHPKTSEPGTWDGPQAQDYAAIGQAADKVRIMAYDHHWSTSAPGAVAPLTWVDQVAAFATTRIAPAKVQLGVPLYGYDWVGSAGEGQTFDVLNSRRTTYGATRQWSTADSAPWFRYTASGVTHEVWYEDAQSVGPKLGVADKYGLAGVVFWRLGGEDPAIWSTARARWGGTTTTTTTTAADTTAPSTPINLKAVAGSRRATVSWTASTDSGGSGVAGYDVYRSTSSTGTFTKVASVTSTSYLNTGLTKNRTYWYYVRGRDKAGNVSAPSAKVSVRPY